MPAAAAAPKLKDPPMPAAAAAPKLKDPPMPAAATTPMPIKSDAAVQTDAPIKAPKTSAEFDALVAVSIKEAMKEEMKPKWLIHKDVLPTIMKNKTEAKQTYETGVTEIKGKIADLENVVERLVKVAMDPQSDSQLDKSQALDYFEAQGKKLNELREFNELVVAPAVEQIDKLGKAVSKLTGTLNEVWVSCMTIETMINYENFEPEDLNDIQANVIEQIPEDNPEIKDTVKERMIRKKSLKGCTRRTRARSAPPKSKTAATTKKKIPKKPKKQPPQKQPPQKK